MPWLCLVPERSDGEVLGVDGSQMGQLLYPTFSLAPPHHLILMVMTSRITAWLTKHVLAMISLVSLVTMGRSCCSHFTDEEAEAQ